MSNLNADILSLLVGLTLVVVVYFSLELALRNQKGEFSFYPDLLTPVGLLTVGYLLAVIEITFLNSADFFGALILLSIVIIPASLGITIIKVIILFIIKKRQQRN